MAFTMARSNNLDIPNEESALWLRVTGAFVEPREQARSLLGVIAAFEY